MVYWYLLLSGCCATLPLVVKSVVGAGSGRFPNVELSGANAGYSSIVEIEFEGFNHAKELVRLKGSDKNKKSS